MDVSRRDVRIARGIPSIIKAIGANANAFLAMIMIGQGINLSMRPDPIKDIFMHLAVRVFFSTLIALAIYFWLPFEEDVRKALAILAFAPIPFRSRSLRTAVPFFACAASLTVRRSSAPQDISHRERQRFWICSIPKINCI